MTIRKKIEKAVEDIEKAREEVISRGGHVIADIVDPKRKKKEWTTLCLRIPMDMVERIDILLDDRVGISRTAWILEALHTEIKAAEDAKDISKIEKSLAEDKFEPWESVKKELIQKIIKEP